MRTKFENGKKIMLLSQLYRFKRLTLKQYNFFNDKSITHNKADNDNETS